jgi:elongation factor G
MIDFKATLRDGRYHDVDSSPAAFELAARGACSALRERGALKLMEPVMLVEVATPEDYVGDVIGDLVLRKGLISGTDQRDGDELIIATVPLANMFGYRNILRSMTQERARFEMAFSHYDSVPRAGFPGGPPDDTFPPAAAMRA